MMTTVIKSDLEYTPEEKQLFMLSDNNTVVDNPSLTKRQLENVQRKSLVNLFSQRVRDSKNEFGQI